MYDQVRDILIATGAASCFSKNLSTTRIESKDIICAVVAHKNQVNTVSWTQKLDGMTNDQILAKDPAAANAANAKTYQVLQAKYCNVAGRNNPVLVVCTMSGALFYEWNGTTLLHWLPTPKANKENWSYMKGIGVQSDAIFVGCYTGEVYCFNVKDATVKQREVLKEHTAIIADVVADRDHMSAAGGDGTIVCWDSDLKVGTKISTQHCITCLAIYKSTVFCATALGLIAGYSIKTGEIALEIAAHARAINALDVAQDAGLLLSGSEDSFVRIWKLHKGDPIEAECAYSKAVENVPITGGCFVDGRGQTFGLTGYDFPTIFYFTRAKK